MRLFLLKPKDLGTLPGTAKARQSTFWIPGPIFGASSGLSVTVPATPMASWLALAAKDTVWPPGLCSAGSHLPAPHLTSCSLCLDPCFQYESSPGGPTELTFLCSGTVCLPHLLRVACWPNSAYQRVFFGLSNNCKTSELAANIKKSDFPCIQDIFYWKIRPSCYTTLRFCWHRLAGIKK